jgi:sarcosine oxidase
MRITIIGAGIFGLAAALELHARGHEVTVCEQEQVPCPRASSTDVSKVIRRTNYRDEIYIELVERAARQWRIWHQQLSGAIYFQTGLLMIERDFSPTSRAYHNWKTFGEREGGVQFLSGREARLRFPQFVFNQDDVLLYDPWTGYLRSGQALIDLAGLARNKGIEIRSQTPAKAIEEIGGAVRVICDETLTCDRVVVATGAWIARLLPELDRHLQITRQQMAFFRAENLEAFARTKFPVWAVSSAGEAWYGFPQLQEGYVKVADDMKLDEVDPDVDREPTDDFMRRVEQFVAERLPALASAQLVGGHSCLYTNTPDNHFIVDWAPSSQRVLIAGCGCGHGFKFGGSIGPVIADALEDKPNPLGDLFLIGNRLSNRSPPS